MFILGFIIFLVLAYFSISSCAEISYFINFPILFMILCFNISVIIGTKSIRDFIYAFKIVFTDKESSELSKLNRGISIIDLLVKVTIGSGCIGALIGFISLLAYLDDPSIIGSSVSIMLFWALYSLSIVVFCLLPAKYILEKKKIVFMEDRVNE